LRVRRGLERVGALILAEETHLIESHEIFGSIDIVPRLAGSVIQGDIVCREKAHSRQSRSGDDHVIDTIDIATYPAAKDGGA
jgi:hypothetical protein